jgi:hypothetical protein
VDLWVYGYQWGFGPFRWAYSPEAMLADRIRVIRQSREESLPMDAIGPTQRVRLEGIPQENLYVGGI